MTLLILSFLLCFAVAVAIYMRRGSVIKTPVVVGGSISFAFKDDVHLHRITDVRLVGNSDGQLIGAEVILDGALELPDSSPGGNGLTLTMTGLEFDAKLPGANFVIEEGELKIKHGVSKLGTAFLKFEANAAFGHVESLKSVSLTYSAPVAASAE